MNKKLLATIITVGLMILAFTGYYILFSPKKIRSNTIERTLAIIKPDAVKAKKTGKIIDRIEQEGFNIVDIRKIQLDNEQIEKFYVEHKAKSFFQGFADYMSSGPVFVIILEKLNAIADWRDLIGTTDPKKAADKTIRKEFGTDIRHNAIHGSHDAAAAEREIKFFFSDRIKK